ncbi:hypothetical protein PULV_a3907 [Pseudoalteromonas ulvae UL12]|uniref:hypothetical protein n=1 Tax=Pseudoalteromonas ulvae TaxID=107327 RepID=UPI00186B6FEC|nr:hypothetical protein [Pseudoalteromonas ulvae]MBE0362108.1 hypothetical protein [Pseudoalteromonas ulvae UL12]
MESKDRWLKLQEELLAAQQKVNFKFRNAVDHKTFLNFLTNNINNLNIIDVEFFDAKIPPYGKLIRTTLIIPEGERLYLETAYYPLARTYFRRNRIAISNKFAYSKHFMERLIERKGIDDMEGIKREIIETLKELERSAFTQEHGALMVETDFIIINSQSIYCCFLEHRDFGEVEAIVKTIIPRASLSKKKDEVAQYILDSFGSDSCSLATQGLPDTKMEADKVISNNKNRMSGDLPSVEELEFRKNLCSGSFKVDKKFNKALGKYLATYDQTSAKCRPA